jgi:hypothetical protein
MLLMPALKPLSVRAALGINTIIVVMMKQASPLGVRIRHVVVVQVIRDGRRVVLVSGAPPKMHHLQ